MKKGGKINPMISGKKVHAIFGFCDIRNFTDTTEVLQEEIMVFVNNIAMVVHDVVDSFGGKANKNIGDAFLLVWKIPKKFLDKEGNIIDFQSVGQIADLPVLSFAKIIIQIRKDYNIQKVI